MLTRGAAWRWRFSGAPAPRRRARARRPRPTLLRLLRRWTRCRRGRDRLARRRHDGDLWWRRRRGILLLFLIPLLDSLLLAVADQPAQQLRLVDADEDVVDRLVHRRVGDDLAGRALAGVDLRNRVVELTHERGELAERLIAVRFVVDEARQESLSVLHARRKLGEVR